MSTALYRRYRSARFADLIGQDQIAATLRNEVASGQLAHAYLFTGIRGTGKTSSARILARAVNCLAPDGGEPCNSCAACVEILGGGAVDVLEIDAASNRGIDEIRDLREKVNYLPASLTRKVYIIDEAHMLTAPAWNAFLKTLEEPPAHVIFVLATTEPHEVPDTIRSRVQRFDFRRVSSADIANHLTVIAEREGVEVESGATALIATAGQGSVRDALSFLDQALATGIRPLSTEVARRALGLADPALLRTLLQAIAAADAAATLRTAALVFDAGADTRQLVRELARLVRATALIGVGYGDGAELSSEDRSTCESLAAARATDVWVDALDLLNVTERELRQPVDARLQVEHCLLRLARPVVSLDAAGIATMAARVAHLEAALAVAAPETAVPAPQPVATAAAVAVVELAEPAASPSPTPAPGALGGPSDVSAWTGLWPRLVEEVNRRDSMVAGVLRDCRPLEATATSLVIGAPYTFHLDRINEPGKRDVVIAAVAAVAGSPREIEGRFCGEDRAGQASGSGGGQSKVTSAALEAFPGSRIVTSRLRDASIDGNGQR